MRVISIGDSVTLRMRADEISLISSALLHPNHAFAAPDFEKTVGASQSQIDEIRKRLHSTLKDRADYSEPDRIRLNGDPSETTQTFGLEVSLTRDDAVLLAKAFKEASELTNEFDSFKTLTGHDWDEAISLQQQLDDLVERLRAPTSL